MLGSDVDPVDPPERPSFPLWLPSSLLAAAAEDEAGRKKRAKKRRVPESIKAKRTFSLGVLLLLFIVCLFVCLL